jgi:hypothetical protein
MIVLVGLLLVAAGVFAEPLVPLIYIGVALLVADTIAGHRSETDC